MDVRCSVSETRCNGGAFRDRSSHPWPLLVWPSLAKQLPPGTTIAPLTWQRHRHGSQKAGDELRVAVPAEGAGEVEAAASLQIFLLLRGLGPVVPLAADASVAVGGALEAVSG